MSWAAHHALITGAAGAIGGALAARLRARFPRARLTLVDVDRAGLERRASAVGGPVTCAVWDLAQPDPLPAALRPLVEAHGPVDLLIGCAGIMDVASVAGTEWSRAARLLDIDLVAPLLLQSLVVPEMLRSRRGVIVNVASMAGLTPLKGCAYYGAAKAGLAMASEVARLELSAHGVTVLTVYPGPVRSALERQARQGFSAGLMKRLLPTGDADALARAILRALDTGAPRVVYPALYGLASLAPPLGRFLTRHFGPTPLV